MSRWPADQLVAARNDGLSYRQIGARFGCSNVTARNTIQRADAAAGSRHTRNRRIDPDVLATIEQMAKAGASNNEIGAAIQMDGSCVAQAIKTHRFERPAPPAAEASVIDAAPVRSFFPLPPGHPATWAAVIETTSFAGLAFGA